MSLLGIGITPASAQQTVDVLSFLLTNRTIITGDFDRDAQASATTRHNCDIPDPGTGDAACVLLVRRLHLYRLDTSLGTVIRSSDSFGPSTPSDR